MTVASSAARVLVLLLVAGHVWGQTPQGQGPAALKKLSLDALQQIEVTSVSRRREQLSGAASSVQVITGEDIRRAGASSIPEALRLPADVQIAPIGSHDLVVAPRGLNYSTANNLPVPVHVSVPL